MGGDAQGLGSDDCEGLGEKSNVKSVLSRIKGKLNIVAKEAVESKSTMELLGGILGTGHLTHQTDMPPMWGATVVSALHAVRPLGWPFHLPRASPAAAESTKRVNPTQPGDVRSRCGR
jgi:hypothetical protein